MIVEAPRGGCQGVNTGRRIDQRPLDQHFRFSRKGNVCVHAAAVHFADCGQWNNARKA